MNVLQKLKIEKKVQIYKQNIKRLHDFGMILSLYNNINMVYRVFDRNSFTNIVNNSISNMDMCMSNVPG